MQLASRKRFELIASSVDLGSALLTDSEYLLDAAAEHQVTLWCHIRSSSWLSPAWMTVTTYYWAFYLLLALTRLTGRTTWFLTGDIVRKLKSLAPNASSSPGQGCYKCVCGGAQSVTDRLLILEKSDSRIHDELWRLWFRTCADRHARLSANSSGSNEARLFAAIAQSARNLGEDWPSAFRNAVNYRQGYAYAAGRGEYVLKSFNFLRNPLSYDFADIIDRLENAVVSARSPSAEPQKVLELLIWTTFALHAIATELHCELIDRHRLDPRWRNSRMRFLRNNDLRSESGIWPC